jgi:dihydrofolate reductase
MSTRSIIALMAAVGENMVIGKDGDLPWHLPSDLRYFKRMTLGKPVIMGRKTLESLGKPLPGRKNIILTRQEDFFFEGTEIATSLDEALMRAGDAEEIVILGGGKVYTELLPQADRLYLTVVHADFDGDTYFPAFDIDEWAVVEQDSREADEHNAHAHTFFVLERRATVPVFARELSTPEPLPAILRRSP